MIPGLVSARLVCIRLLPGGLGRFAQHAVQLLGQPLRAHLVVIDIRQLPVRADQIDQRTVVDRIRHARFRFFQLLAIQPVAERCAQYVGERPDVLHAARQTHDAVIEEAHILIQPLCTVIDRIDGHEHRHDGVRVLQRLHHLAKLEQRGRADVRARGVADGQQQVFARKRILRHLALHALQVEVNGAPHFGLPCRLHNRPSPWLASLDCPFVPFLRHAVSGRYQQPDAGCHCPPLQHDHLLLKSVFFRQNGRRQKMLPSAVNDTTLVRAPSE